MQVQRNRFFLVAPHLALLAEQAELLVDSNPLLTETHYESGATFQQKREDEVFALIETISQLAILSMTMEAFFSILLQRRSGELRNYWRKASRNVR